MNLKKPPLSTFVMAAWVVLISIPALGQNHPQFRRPVVMTFSQAEATKDVRAFYIAVMGAVSRPGTYHLDPSELNISSVIKRAGGLSKEATRTIHVIRQGRFNTRVYLSDDSNDLSNLLLPGDLVIVEQKPSPNAVGNATEFVSDPTTIPASYEIAAPSPGIQVALLNVLDYPFVVVLRPEEANEINILDRLGQPAELHSHMRVLLPDGRPKKSDATDSSMILVSGSSVVFDRGYVLRDQLPSSLPMPIESDIAIGAQSGLIGSPQGQSLELRNVGQQMYLSGTGSINDSAPLQHSSSGMSPSNELSAGHLTNEWNSEQPNQVSRSNPRVTTIPFNGVQRITKSSAGNSTSESPASDQIPPPDDRATDPRLDSPTIDSGVPIEDSLVHPDNSSQSTSMTPLAILATALVTMIIGFAVYFRLQSGSPVGQPYFAPEPIDIAVNADQTSALTSHEPEGKSPLERIIKFEIPLTIETVEFPSGLTLQGRIATKPVLRVDGLHNVFEQHPPHFTPSNPGTNQNFISPVNLQMELDPPQSIPRRPHFQMAEKLPAETSANSPIDPQNLTSNRVAERTNAPLASALFELEQGGRS